MSESSETKCGLCGEPMPPGEEMFQYHGHSGPCPKAALNQPSPPAVGLTEAERSYFTQWLEDELNEEEIAHRNGYFQDAEYHKGRAKALDNLLTRDAAAKAAGVVSVRREVLSERQRQLLQFHAEELEAEAQEEIDDLADISEWDETEEAKSARNMAHSILEIAEAIKAALAAKGGA
jgi:hypothetical protein